MATTSKVHELHIEDSNEANISLQKKRMTALKEQMLTAVADSTYEFIVTFGSMLIALVAVTAVANGNAFLASWGMFVIISVYMILLIIRFVHKFDNSSTNDEIANLLYEMNETLGRIERNA
jgi:membrane protein implicated in regulation of membrane protease activity